MARAARVSGIDAELSKFTSALKGSSTTSKLDNNYKSVTFMHETQDIQGNQGLQ